MLWHFQYQHTLLRSGPRPYLNKNTKLPLARLNWQYPSQWWRWINNFPSKRQISWTETDYQSYRTSFAPKHDGHVCQDNSHLWKVKWARRRSNKSHRAICPCDSSQWHYQEKQGGHVDRQRVGDNCSPNALLTAVLARYNVRRLVSGSPWRWRCFRRAFSPVFRRMRQMSSANQRPLFAGSV